MKKQVFFLLSLFPLWAVAQNVVTLECAGNLQSQVESSGLKDAIEITVKGELNGTDLRYLRMMCGGEIVTTYSDPVNTSIQVFKGSLERLDLSEARIVSGGDFYNNVHPGMSNLTFMYSQDDVLGDCLFESCTQLRSVVLPNQLKVIGRYCFWNTRLTEIEVPNGVERIMSHAFEFNTTLESVALPWTLETVEALAFNGCSNLNQIRLGANVPPAYGYKLFENEVLENCMLIVPTERQNQYLEADGWKKFTDIKPWGVLTEDNSPRGTSDSAQRKDFYDLQGRLSRTVAADAQKGIYVSKGKKLVK